MVGALSWTDGDCLILGETSVSVIDDIEYCMHYARLYFPSQA
jgi:hypothetical protein